MFRCLAYYPTASSFYMKGTQCGCSTGSYDSQRECAVTSSAGYTSFRINWSAYDPADEAAVEPIVVGTNTCRRDICTDFGGDCCAPWDEARGCSDPAYSVFPNWNGATGFGTCVSTFGHSADY
jgi:hypothetical protein